MAFKVALLVLSIIALSTQSPVPENSPLTKLPVGDSSEKKPEVKPPVLPTPISLPNNANATVSASSTSTLKTFNNGQPQTKTQADHAAEANLKLTLGEGNAKPQTPNSATNLRNPTGSSTTRPAYSHYNSNNSNNPNNRYNPSQQAGRITKREAEDDSEGFAPQDDLREDSPFGNVVAFDSRNRRIKVLPAFLG